MTQVEKPYTTLDHVTHVEGHDDLYRSHRATFLEGVLQRTASQAFHQFLGTWPTSKVKAKTWNEGDFTYVITVRYEHWTMTGEFDASSYYNGTKQEFCDKLDAFCREMSEKFKAEEASCRPWWRDYERLWTFSAPLKHGSKQYTKLVVKLAEIKQRGKRFQWHLIPDEYQRDDWNVTEHKQGYAKSLEEAKAIVVGAWKDHGRESGSTTATQDQPILP